MANCCPYVALQNIPESSKEKKENHRGRTWIRILCRVEGGYLGMRVAYQSHQLKAHWVAALLVYCRWSLSYVYFDTCKFMCTVTINDNVTKNKKMGSGKFISIFN